MASSLRLALLSLSVAALFSISFAIVVTDGDELFAATSTSSSKGTVVIATDTLVLTRGISINQNLIIKCESGYECVIDISPVSYTDAFLIHGGPAVTLEGLTLDGKGVPRNSPAIYATGLNSKVALNSVTVQHCNNTAPLTLGGGIEIDRNVLLTVYGASSFIGNAAPYGPAVGAKDFAQVRLCFVTFTKNIGSSQSADVFVQDQANVQACAGGQTNTAAPKEHTNTTGGAASYNVFHASSSSSCPLTVCANHPQ